MTDDELRIEALRLAIPAMPEHDANTIIKRATKYYNFLAGREDQRSAVLKEAAQRLEEIEVLRCQAELSSEENCRMTVLMAASTLREMADAASA